MSVLPIIERELRLALRKQRPVRRRLRMAAACAGGTVLFLLMAQVTGNGQASRELHQIFCLVGLYTVLRAPQLAAGLFARERRDQTLGLLFISGLSAGEVFLSKVLSAAAMAFTDLLAIFPMLALPFLMGGVSFDLFLATIFCLPSLLLFALSVALLASVLSDDDGAAVLLAAWIGLAICALPPVVSLANGYFSGTPASPWGLRLSPAYGAWLVLSRFSSATAIEFWRSFAATAGWSGLCLTAAALL